MSQHWYRLNGEAAHFLGPNGSGTTLREARKHRLVPSVSTVLSIIAKPQLERWKREQSVMAALTIPRIEGETSEELLRRIEHDANKQVNEAAELGSMIHAAIEDSFLGRPVDAYFRPHVSAVHQVLADNYGGVPDWEVEQSFAHPAGFGGKMDIRSRSLRLIGDHKGVQVAPDEDKQLAHDQHWQLGGYAEGLDMPDDCRGFNLFISRTHPGHVRFHEWSPEKMRQGREVFMATLRTWQAIKGFKP